MSKVVMRDSDGGGQSRDGSAIQHHRSSFGFENFEVNGQQRKKPRRGQLQKNEENEEEKPELSKTFMCMQEGCVRTFSSRFKLDRHSLIHSDDRPFQCSTCGKGFHRKDHLKNHLQVHNPNKVQHTCELCQKRYSSVMSYRKHVALHAAEQGDLVCKLCGKVMADREGIMHHLKVHTGSRTLRGPSERKYPCDLCERCFFTKKDVKRHLVVHTGDRDFVCQFCPQRFGRKDHLVRHTKKGHSNLSSPPTNGDLPRKYEVPTPLPPTSENNNNNNNNHHHHKNGNGMVSGSSPDHLPPGLVIAPAPVMDHPPVLEPVKPDPTYGIPHSNIVHHSNYGINLLPGENGQNLGRFGEPALLPVSQYLPMPSSYPGVGPIMSHHHHYINMSTASSTLPDHLPLMSMAPTFTPSLALEVNNPPLPHFNQAFQ